MASILNNSFYQVLRSWSLEIRWSLKPEDKQSLPQKYFLGVDIDKDGWWVNVNENYKTFLLKKICLKKSDNIQSNSFLQE